MCVPNFFFEKFVVYDQTNVCDKKIDLKSSTTRKTTVSAKKLENRDGYSHFLFSMDIVIFFFIRCNPPEVFEIFVEALPP